MMKKGILVALALALVLTAALAFAEGFDAAQFPTWFEEEGIWRTVANDTSALEGGAPGGFVTDASGAPSVEDLKEMLHMASLAVTSNGKTDWYMVAVTDPDEQLAIIGDRFGTATSAGTATVLVFGERLLREDVRKEEGDFQPDRGYYDAGNVTGYLNIAAIAKGYANHMFLTPALEGVNGFNNGDVGLDCAKYLEGTTYINGATEEEYSNDDMKFICAVVIGTADPDVESGLTTHEFPDNWSIYDAK